MTPSDDKTADIVFTSTKSGTFSSSKFSLVRILAAIIGRDAFFDPLTGTEPWRRFPPFINIFCMNDLKLR